jgi:osmotically inducible protein OsmC
LSAVLGNAGYDPKRIHTTATVRLEQVDGAPWITKIHLDCEAEVPGVDEETFAEQVQASKTGCPVSKALKGVEISVEAKLTN